jgi:hypothetical protein
MRSPTNARRHVQARIPLTRAHRGRTHGSNRSLRGSETNVSPSRSSQAPSKPRLSSPTGDATTATILPRSALDMLTATDFAARQSQPAVSYNAHQQPGVSPAEPRSGAQPKDASRLSNWNCSSNNARRVTAKYVAFRILQPSRFAAGRCHDDAYLAKASQSRLCSVHSLQ